MIIDDDKNNDDDDDGDKLKWLELILTNMTSENINDTRILQREPFVEQSRCGSDYTNYNATVPFLNCEYR